MTREKEQPPDGEVVPSLIRILFVLSFGIVSNAQAIACMLTYIGGLVIQPSTKPYMQSINVSTDGPVAGLGWISGPGRRKASDLQFFQFFIYFYFPRRRVWVLIIT